MIDTAGVEPQLAEMSPTASDEEWTMVIRPQSPWYDLRLAELWQARELIALFVWRDFVSVYKQTILGPLWYLIQPLLTTITFTIIFGNIAKLPTDGLPPFLFYMSGTVIWSYFAGCLTKTSNTFTQNSALFGKVYFSRMAVPVSILVSNLVTFGIQFVLFLVFLVYFMFSDANIAPNLGILFTPVLLLIMAAQGLGFGIIISSVTTRYRDLQFLVAFGAQLWMYATSVIYPLSVVPERYRWLVLLNPLTPVIEAFRLAYLGSGTVTVGLLAYTSLFTVVILLVGLILFHRVERTFMDTV
jgi:lipopolysaccharide transport system permease protein